MTTTLQTITAHVQELVTQQLPKEYNIQPIPKDQTKGYPTYAINKTTNNIAKNSTKLLYVYYNDRVISSAEVHTLCTEGRIEHPYADPEFPENFIKHLLTQI